MSDNIVTLKSKLGSLESLDIARFDKSHLSS